jgi:hypothetical protein
MFHRVENLSFAKTQNGTEEKPFECEVAMRCVVSGV